MSVSRKKEEPYPSSEWIETTIDDLKDLIENKADGFIQNIVRELHPADLAEISSHLSKEDRLYLFSILDSETASEVLLEIDQPLQNEILQQVDDERISEVIEEMDSDDAADIVAELPDEVAEKVLETISDEDSAQVRELLTHEEDTAGGIMAKEFVAVNKEMTVDQAIQVIRKTAEEVEDIYNVFAIDDENRLVGVIPLKQLLLARPGVKVHNILKEEVIFVRADIDQEEVALIFKKYDLISIPVVDEEKRLIGRITIDDVIDVIEDEASEDVQKIAGITELDISETSPFRVTKSRLPWLVVAFVGQLVSALLLSMFEATMKEVMFTVLFIPLVMALGGNVGNQSAMVIIRGLATGEIALLETKRRLKNEFWVALLLGGILAILIYFVVGLGFQNFNLGITIAVSLILVVVTAAITGALLPFLFRKANIDPAVATSPFITTTNDILGLLIYFGTISLYLRWII